MVFTSLLLQASGSTTGGMADFVSDLSNTIGIDLFDKDIDNVVFQTNEFLCNSDFIGSQGPFWWLAHFCFLLRCQYYVNQRITFFCLVRQIPNGTKTGQNHRKIKSRTLQARHPLSWTSLFCAKVQFCPVKNKQNPANMLPIKHLYYMCIFRKILQVLHAQTCVAYFKDLLKSVLCHLYTTVLPPMRIALEQCTTHLPLSAMRKYVFHQQIGKKCHMAQ